MATLSIVDGCKRSTLLFIMSLIILQLCISMLSSVSMINMDCDHEQMSMTMEHHDGAQCHLSSDHQSMCCLQLCNCLNALIPAFFMPHISASFVYHLIAHPLLTGIQFSPPLPPP